MTKKQHLIVPVNVQILKKPMAGSLPPLISELGVSGFVTVCPKSKLFLLFTLSFLKHKHLFPLPRNMLGLT